ASSPTLPASSPTSRSPTSASRAGSQPSARSPRCCATSETGQSWSARARSSRRPQGSNICAMERTDLSDRRFEVLLERLDRIGDELGRMNKRLDHDEHFLRLTRELAALNE